MAAIRYTIYPICPTCGARDWVTPADARRMRGASDVMCAGCGYRTLAMPGFAFDVDTDTTAYSTEPILRGERPILLVLHEADGSWQFLHGEHVDIAERVAVQ